LKVVDLFCGAGGFSEGFQQAGFEVVFAVDNWEQAVITHKRNHPGSLTIIDDVVRISYLSDEEFHKIIPDTEIIIGSPPCVSFSSSNKSGKADKSEGIKLIRAFLRIVARKKWKENSILKYWIMENVPNSRFFIDDKYSANDLDLDGKNTLLVKNSTSDIYNASYFGVPSRRKRYFCGEFPEPVKTNGKESKLPLSHILSALGKPYEKFESFIVDPIYDQKMFGSEVTDHHYIHKVAKYQWENAKRLKQDKGYMGRMPFPENINKPARTIMATMTFGARESMIFADSNGGFRAPTIREVASLMSFPISYNFYGSSIGLKYRLVGNAVPPCMAYAFAKAILKNENNYSEIKQNINNFRPSEQFIDFNGKDIQEHVENRKYSKARFKYHIPYMIIDRYRVELSNHSSDFEKHDFIWEVEIHKGQGPAAKKFHPIIYEGKFTEVEKTSIHEFLTTINKKMVSSNEFQVIYCMTSSERKIKGFFGPIELLEAIKTYLNDVPLEDKPISILIDDQIIYIPKRICIGYFVLDEIVNYMKRLGEENGQRVKKAKIT
jgi:DNA (cytosine-5)-methyltransferase 1